MNKHLVVFGAGLDAYGENLSAASQQCVEAAAQYYAANRAWFEQDDGVIVCCGARPETARPAPRPRREECVGDLMMHAVMERGVPDYFVRSFAESDLVVDAFNHVLDMGWLNPDACDKSNPLDVIASRRQMRIVRRVAQELDMLTQPIFTARPGGVGHAIRDGLYALSVLDAWDDTLEGYKESESVVHYFSTTYLTIAQYARRKRRAQREQRQKS